MSSRNILIILLDDFNILQMAQPFGDLLSPSELDICFLTHDHNIDFIITNKDNLYILIFTILLSGH